MTVIVPPMVTLPVVAEGPTRMPVAPLAELDRVMVEPASRSTELLLSTVRAVPVLTAMLPPDARRMSSRAVPVAVEVTIGVVREF